MAELIMVDTWGGGVLQPPSLPRTPWEEEADRKGEVAETGRRLQREVGERWEVKPEMSSTGEELNITSEYFTEICTRWWGGRRGRVLKV